MTIDEAIKILRDPEPANHIYTVQELSDAMKLGIEALKRIKNERDIQGGLYNYELPGETKE